jgi:hypothetical protein
MNFEEKELNKAIELDFVVCEILAREFKLKDLDIL